MSLERLKDISVIVSDVDGVLTDGSIIVGPGGEIKVFNVRDGMGIKLFQKSGGHFAILSGRASKPVLERARELGIDEVKTGRLDKEDALAEICKSLGVSLENLAYIGDDIPDIAPIQLAALGFCPQDAVKEVQAAADLIVPINGGAGVVRYVIELILKEKGFWAEYLSQYEVKRG